MRHFSKYSIDDFNYLLSKENHLKDSDTFSEVVDKIEADEMSYFYVSIDREDIEEVMDNEPEMVEMLGGLNLIEVEGEKLYFCIATY